MASRVSVTPEALEGIAALKAEFGPLLFFQSGGCCENTAPQCFPVAEFKVSPNDVHIGDIGGVPYYMGMREFEFWQNTHLIVDVVSGRCGTMSLDPPGGKTFICRSRLFTDEELKALGIS